MSYPVTVQRVPKEILATNDGAVLLDGGVQIATGQTIVAGTVLGQITASGLWKAYASGNSDGSQVPYLIAAQNVDTTTAGNGSNIAPCAAYVKGVFVKSALTGLDANALSVRTNWLSHTSLDRLII